MFLTSSFLCSSQGRHTSYVTAESVSPPNLIHLGHSNETATVIKHVTKYKHMRKWMVVFLGKFENRVIKIARDNSIRTTKSINLL